VLPGKQYSIDDVIGILLRGKWLIIIPFGIGLSAAVPVSKKIPERYRSETLIMVVPQQVPDSYVKPVVTTPVAERLPAINEQLQSRSRLEHIVESLDLYKEQRANGAIMEDLVARMREEIEIQFEGKEAFRVSYVSDDAKTAQQVTERLASLFIEEHLRDRARLTEGTGRFLEAQLEDAKRRLLDQEKKLEEYSRRYAGQLPTQLASNLQSIQNAQLQLQAVSESMNRAQERRLLIEGQIADAESRPAGLLPAALPVDPMTSGTAAQQLEATKARLEQFQQRFTPEHPDVRALQRAVKELEVKVKEEAKRPPESTPSSVVSPAEAARQSRLRDLQAQMQVIDHQLTAGQAEESRLKSVITDLQAKVDAAPTREAELVELTRDYGALQKSYSELLSKREQSKLAADLERRQIGEQFKILDPASLPERPYNQIQRIALSLSGAIAGLMLGLGLVVTREFRDMSIKSEDDAVRLLELPVLALVPAMAPESDRSGGRLRRFVVLATVVLILGSVTALIVWRMQA
jgi:polysaccharide chain length determinant protein (PEP-CTERM system associated)